MSDDERSIWDITPYKVKIELSEGSIRMRQQAMHTGRLRVAKATDITNGPEECAWLYLHAEDRDGADVKLTTEQARHLRDALNECVLDNENDE